MTFDDLGWKMAGVIGGLWLGAVSWIAGKAESRIKDLEDRKAEKATLEKILERMEASDERGEAHRTRVYDKLDETITAVNAKFDATIARMSDNSARIARLEGRAEK